MGLGGHMDIKRIGELRASPMPEGRLDSIVADAARQVGSWRSLHEHRPLSTGSLTIDHATGFGGLPRGHVVGLGIGTEPGDAILGTTLSRTQDRGGVIVVLDAVRRFLPDQAAELGIDPRRIIVIEPESPAKALEVARRLLDLGGVDLVVVDGADEVVGAAEGGGPVASRIASWHLRRELERLHHSVHDSRSCLLITHRAEAPASRVERAISEMTDLKLDAGSTAEPSGRAIEVQVTGAAADEPRRVTVDLEPGGLVARVADLIGPGIAEDLIERHGRFLTYGPNRLGTTRDEVIRSVAKDSDLALDLERRVEQAVRKQGEKSAATLEAGRAAVEPAPARPRGPREAPPPEPPEQPEPTAAEAEERAVPPLEGRPGPAQRYVNTRFEGEGDPLLPLVVDRTYTFLLNIGPRREPEEGAESAEFAEPDFGGRTELDLLVSLYSEDFRIKRPRLPLTLPRAGASKDVWTGVTPSHPGECRILVAISLRRELELLQELEVAVPAESRTPAVTGSGTGG